MYLFWRAGCQWSHPTCTVLLSGSICKWPPPPPLQPLALPRPLKTQVPDPAARLRPTVATRTARLSATYVSTPPRMQWSACVDTSSGKNHCLCHSHVYSLAFITHLRQGIKATGQILIRPAYFTFHIIEREVNWGYTGLLTYGILLASVSFKASIYYQRPSLFVLLICMICMLV